MNVLDGYSKVAAVRYNNSQLYYFAIYNDGNDYQVGDMVILSGTSPRARIVEILNKTEFEKKYKISIIQEVIGKIDTTEYDKRVMLRKRKAELKKKMKQRKEEIQRKLDDEYYASKDEVYAEMLKEYNNI